MAVLPLVIAPDERLNQMSMRVDIITPELKKLAADMLETMYANNGIGLAAVQVGVHKRLVVVDVDWPSPRYEGEPESEQREGNPMVLFNPEVIKTSEETSLFNEGCLSFPDQYSDVERPSKASIRYMDLDGSTKIIDADEMLATCIQHEIDHINGIVFVDHISKLKREMIIKKLKKQKKLGNIDHTQNQEHAAL